MVTYVLQDQQLTPSCPSEPVEGLKIWKSNQYYLKDVLMQQVFILIQPKSKGGEGQMPPCPPGPTGPGKIISLLPLLL